MFEKDTSKLEKCDHMFASAYIFNQDLSTKIINAGTEDEYIAWDMSSAINMKRMFDDARVFNQDISNWDTSSVENMYGMFKRTNSFNKDISNWDTSSVTDMSYMFNFASVFNQDLSNWNLQACHTIYKAYLDSGIQESNKLDMRYLTLNTVVENV